MPQLNYADATLVLLTLSGDPNAYDELVRRHEKSVRAAAYSVIRNSHIAEDAAQDAFLAAWLKLDRLREPEKFAVWVCRIAKNCALNMVRRFRDYLALDEIGEAADLRLGDCDPESMLMTEEEAGLIRRGLRKLPERAQQVVWLHYYEDMSAEEIARIMGISVGTVKSQLHDGRRKMRKELCAMDEKLNDTLLQKINKKIAELKSWQFRNSKEGFDKVYKDVLKDVDSMPECREKYHALADVLLRGYWWLPGEKNDRLMERIREAARLGRNNEVMETVMSNECFKLWGDDRRRHIKDVQIPSLDPVDFRLTLASRWFAYASECDASEPGEAYEALDNALRLLTPSDTLYYGVINAKKIFEEASSEEFSSDLQNRMASSVVYEIRKGSEPGSVQLQSFAFLSIGRMYGYSWLSDQMVKNLALCDGTVTAKIKPGESAIASDGSTLTFEADGEEVETPAGKFTGCEVWTTRRKGDVIRNRLKSGIGLVKQEVISEGVRDAKLLTGYKNAAVDGLSSLRRGNFWEYRADCNEEAYVGTTRIEVMSADGEKAVVTVINRAARKKYDENSWLDMILKTRADYISDRQNGEKIQDVRPYAKRAIELAKTFYEKAYAETAYSVVKRIIETDRTFSPDGEAVGFWNFFVRSEVEFSDGRTRLFDGSGRFSFEWKCHDGTNLCDRLLSNHVYWILNDVAGCVFDEQWKPGYESEEFRDHYGQALKTKIKCESAGTVSVKAGSFENCLSVDTVCEGFDKGQIYRGGRRTYYFAPGVGIVKVEIYDKSGFMSSYELTDYEGEGEGYMPIEEGMKRRYEDLGLTDGYEGAAAYIYAKDCEGKTVVLSDYKGICRKLPTVTRYDTVIGEQREESLANEEKYGEANTEGCCNAINILLHQMKKGFHHFWEPLKRARRCCYNLRLMEAAGNGVIPPAFYARASRSCLLAAVAFIGGGEKEEGYRYLELALDYAEKWKAIPDGEKLSFGDEAVFGGIVYIKGQSVIELPDGSRRPVDACDSIDGRLFDSGTIYYALTAPKGWEWFDPARGEERYKEITERARRVGE